MTVSKVLFSHKSDEWETPQNLFDELDDEFHFELDVCATPQNAKCSKFFTANDDSLLSDWGGVVIWCNPPYSDIKNWAKKCSEHKGVAVMLVPARTDTAWFHDYVYGKAELRFVRGRLHFNNSKNSAPFPSMIAIFRNNGL